jgi:hypothetical protein
MGKAKNGDIQIERERALTFNHICKSFLKAKIWQNIDTHTFWSCVQGAFLFIY